MSPALLFLALLCGCQAGQLLNEADKTDLNNQFASDPDLNRELADAYRCVFSYECPAGINPEFLCVGVKWNGQVVQTMGYCMPPLEPGSYGCKLDEQCQLLDQNTYCAQEYYLRDGFNQKPCRCKEGFQLNPRRKNCVPELATEGPQPEAEEEDLPSVLSKLTRCMGNAECNKNNVSLICMAASIGKQGYCLPALKPMEYGCLLDEQCEKACPTSHCSTQPRFRSAKGQNQCRCNEKKYYMFKKCWNKCLADISVPDTEADGTQICRPILDDATPDAETYLRRYKRQIHSTRIIC